MLKERELRVEYINIDVLTPYVNNSRTHSDEQIKQICKSIMEFGFTNPVLIDECNGIIAGHGRLMAAKELNFDIVPVVRLTGLTEAQKRAYIIADNQLALNAGWDLDKLNSEVMSLKDLDFDIDILGFSANELDKLFEDVNCKLDLNEAEQLIDEAKNILLIEFDSEFQLQQAYEEYSSKGFKCKILE